MQAMQLPVRLDLTTYAGDDFEMTVIIVDVDVLTGTQTAANFTGASAKMSIKSRPDDAEIDAVLVLTSNPAAGLSFPSTDRVKIALTDTQTAALPNAALYYDLQITTAAGAIRTYFAGNFITQNDVTR